MSNVPGKQIRQHWRKLKKHQIPDAEAILRSQEIWCMNACSRFLNRDSIKQKIWALNDHEGKISALIIFSRQSVLPVLCGHDCILPPGFLRSLGKVVIHSVQGRKQDAMILEAALEKIGLFAAETTDYDVMSIDRPPSDYLSAGPSGLVIRKPQLADMNDLAVLHAAYEQEEVLPAASEFSAAVSRMNIERIFAKEHMLVAEWEGRLIGKINTNAVTFTRYQVGGVYVLPEYRGLGIARRMAGEFTAGLVIQGRGISLFVKKSNPAARRVYRRIGFAINGDYRISYY